MSNWTHDPTLVTGDVTDEYKSTLSAFFSVPYRPGVQDIPQKHEDILSILKAHGIPTDSTLSFDYIIVGGGAAGLALATRLAESLESGRYVCVVEAGTYRQDAIVDVPGMMAVATKKPDYDWSYDTTPQPNMQDRQVRCSAGRILGGSTAINFHARTRASSPEYDAWNEFGSGWDWKGLLPYFKAQESYTSYEWGTDEVFPGITKEEDQEARRLEPNFRGNSGPVHSTHNTVYTDLMKPTIEAAFKFGIKTNRTPGYGDSTGMFNMDTAVNRKEGTRSYAANAYLKDPGSAVPQPNLVILKGVYVTKILFDSNNSGKDAKATGLACLGGIDWKSAHPSSFPFELRANKEIIVSTGAYNTPRLLELSGVGNPEILSKFGITPVIKLPTVGENFQNHLNVLSDFIVKPDVFTLDRMRIDPTYKAQQVQEYRENRTGAYATSLSAYAFIKFKNFLTEQEVAELKADLEKDILNANNQFHKQQLIIQRRFLDNDGVGDVEIILVPRVSASVPKENTSYISFMVSLSHPVSRGSVHITSSDPLAPPSINPMYLSSTYDIKVMTKATMFARKLSETAPLKDIIVAPSTPGPEIQTEAQFKEFVHQRITAMDHPMGSASMAPQELGGVVDQNLRIYGTQNVRVADMSIAPLIMATHLLDTAYAIGEKAAALIKAGRDIK